MAIDYEFWAKAADELTEPALGEAIKVKPGKKTAKELNGTV